MSMIARNALESVMGVESATWKPSALDGSPCLTTSGDKKDGIFSDVIVKNQATAFIVLASYAMVFVKAF